MFRANIFGGLEMFDRATSPQRHLLALPKRKPRRDRTEGRWKDQSFPEYIVDVTRNSILSLTTSLTKVSTQVHDFFARINAILAFERMMRTCMSWMMPGFATPSPMEAMGMAMGTAGAAPMGMAMPQMWGVPAWFANVPQFVPQPKPQPQPPKALLWFGADLLALPKPQPKPAPTAAPLGAVADLPVYGALLALPMAFMAMAPSMMQAWNLAA